MKLEQALRRIHSAGPSKVVITCGSEGGFWMENGEVGRYSAYLVDVVDTTGAGDAFHGAYLFALSRKWEMEKRCRFSSGVAALVCRAMGGRSAAPTYAQAMEFVGQFE
jgi:sulfofructose kinase